MLNIFNKIPVAVLLILSASGVISGDFFAKLWSVKQQPIFFILSIIGYLASGFFFIPTLLREGLVMASVIWSLIGIIGFLIIGLVIFKETLTPLQIVGVAMGVISLLILSLS